MKEYDDADAVVFINDRLASLGRERYPEDELYNVVDMIWDFRDENGLLDIDAEADDADDTDDPQLLSDLLDYIHRMLRKDKEARVIPDDVPLIVKAHTEYEDTLD